MNKCRGCGAELQSNDPSVPGYLPSHILEDPGKQVICQRCFRITNYGKDEIGPISAGQALGEIKKGVATSEAVVWILDVADFEASLSPELIELVQDKPLFVVVNKTDLLPPKTPPQEAADWAARMLRKSQLRPRLVAAVSAKKDTGLTTLLTELQRAGLRRFAVIGVTNVGKSMLISRLAVERGGLAPTVSSYPGTTVSKVEWKLAGDISLLDTPGWVPAGRLTEYVCDQCVPKVVPSRRMDVQVVSVDKETALVVPGIAAARVRADGSVPDGVVLGFSASEMTWQRANPEKIGQWLGKKGCPNCSFSQWEEQELNLPPFSDLSIYGLGWLSSRRQALRLVITLPSGVRIAIRPNLVGPK